MALNYTITDKQRKQAIKNKNGLKFSKKLQLSVVTKIPSEKGLDDICREVVRIRDQWSCRRCHRKASDGWKLEWAHFHSRQNKAIRWDLDNSALLCFNCHYKFMHGHDAEVRTAQEVEDFWKGLIGERQFNALQLRANNKGGDRRLIKIYLDQELKKLQKSGS